MIELHWCELDLLLNLFGSYEKQTTLPTFIPVTAASPERQPIHTPTKAGTMAYERALCREMDSDGFFASFRAAVHHRQ